MELTKTCRSGHSFLLKFGIKATSQERLSRPFTPQSVENFFSWVGGGLWEEAGQSEASYQTEKNSARGAKKQMAVCPKNVHQKSWPAIWQFARVASVAATIRTNGATRHSEPVARTTQVVLFSAWKHALAEPRVTSSGRRRHNKCPVGSVSRQQSPPR